MKIITFLLACNFISFSFSQDITLEPFATGLSNPVNVKHAGDDRLFVAERGGVIKVINADGSINVTRFLDIDDRVTNSGGEQGLLAMAFHPSFINNGYFYVNYIDNDGDTVISRFTRSATGIANPDSETILLHIMQPFANHNGGDMHFGPDGYLYISLGDGGATGDPGNRAQSLNTLLGKLLRIDVNATDMGNYGIPIDNPFINNQVALNEIWAYGLRNPWKFSFDSTTGNLWTADVGEGQIEEINKMDASSTGGENYGWKCFEGNSPFQSSTACDNINQIAPIAQYTHSSSSRCSITGGYIYRGSIHTTFQGLYFFADFCSDEIGFVEETPSGGYNLSFIKDLSGLGISAFGEDVNGELYIVSLFQGAIFRLNEATLGIDSQSINQIEMYPNPAEDILTFDLLNTSNQLDCITIYDTRGKLIEKHSNFGAQFISISTESLTTGFYIVEIKNTQGDRSTRKLIVD